MGVEGTLEQLSAAGHAEHKVLVGLGPRRTNALLVGK